MNFTSCHAQEDEVKDTRTPDPASLYLGQKPPGLTPELFAPEIFAEPGYSEHVYNIIPGEMACVFDRYAEYGFPQGEIFISRIVDGHWTEPELFEVFKDNDFVFLPTISPDGNRWFFTSNSIPLPAGEQGKIPLFFIEKTDDGWSQPSYLGQHIHASATIDGTLFIMVEGRDGGRPAFRKLVDGHYSDYEFVEPAEYFMERDAHLVVDPQGQYLIFDSQSRPRLGDCMLFISFKRENGLWTKPTSMGQYIKQKAAIAWISYDGNYIFYKAGDDVYWVSSKVIEKMRLKDMK
jgi:hypothetical protein